MAFPDSMRSEFQRLARDASLWGRPEPAMSWPQANPGPGRQASAGYHSA
ncbi:hypothetical protein PAMC26510_08920 [Caballeronia sordidicola]|uniref:Uncharacterized protein n=1 Tax=Caballeronia sordidicola TaxID=196367 RepID=A0A242N151_CABSO|nr:hypothetical protein PAMC26510_08920 [Caballeronia sordidicola]